jgi:hypothetical protein
MSGALLGLQVKLPTDCKCGNELAVIGPGNGKHPATLQCSQCECHRGCISEFTLSFIEAVAARYGAPTAIMIRASAIVAVPEGST